MPRTLPGGHRLLWVPDSEVLAEAAAGWMLGVLRAALARDGRAVAALSGGRTPGAAYGLLARLWRSAPGLSLLQVDERLVASDRRDSNAAMIRAAWVGPTPLEPMVRSAWGADVATAGAALAAAYAVTLWRRAGRPGRRLPRLHLAVLGLGEDGHTASLFPGSAALEDRMRWVLAVPAPSRVSGSPAVARLTLGLPLLAAAEQRLFLVSGASKAAALRRTLLHPESGLPARRLATGRADTIWLVDAAAASELPL